ncbi:MULTISPECIES: hypothetical protein [Pseudomonas]|jgi:hypothetical protein|uniref:hypothetical protein n=1 Tax=Pseudomonas TaxID=286 RepID=UPI000908A7FC|nr:hypothetical protein [Pseudomonas sp. NFACC10-1]SFW74524.1 hypothetical protein SAMN03159505_03279 [Pseudomonas sp. NFACC10-1]
MGELKLVIDLSKSETERLKNPADILQRGAFERLARLIQHQLDFIPEDSFADIRDTDLSYPRTHNAVLIEGGRGSGKTTFLLTALLRLRDARDEVSEIAQKLHVLPMIDPTLIETKENIIIVILSMIEAAAAHVPGDHGQLDKAKQALAEGLGLLDGIGANSAYGSEWEDANWVMSRGLHKAMKGRLFERKLSAYIEAALNLLKKQAFVLAFDDVDTNFAQGHTILETIRKYLTSPRLVLLLSGDLDLYGRLLRRSIYDTFGNKILKQDPGIIGDDKQNVANAVLELEEQYLLKVVPPQHRISMLPLGGIIQSRQGDVQIVLSSNNGTYELKSWASGRIRDQLIETTNSRLHPFFDFVAMEHLRLVIGYLRALAVDDLQQSRKAVLTVFEARLRTMGVPIDLIDNGNYDYALRATFNWLVRQENAPDLLRFGVPPDRTKAIVVHCLALALSQGLEVRHGGVLQALFALALPITMMHRPELGDEKTRKSVFDFLWTQSSPPLPELAARIGSIDRSWQEIGRMPASSFGSVGLASQFKREDILPRIYGVKDVKGKLTVNELKEKVNGGVITRNWIDEISNAGGGDLLVRNGVGWFSIDDLQEERCEKFGDILNRVVYKRFSKRGEAFRSISALSLFAVIGDLLMTDEIIDFAAHAVTSTVPAFGSVAAPDDYDPTTEEDIDEPSNDDTESDEEATTAEQNVAFAQFMTNLKNWHAFSRKHTTRAAVSPAMLGSIASRIHDDLMGLDEKVTLSWKSGEILHRQITTILHVILVVTSNLSGRKESPKMSDLPFGKALGQITTGVNETLHPLAVILLSCPLVWIFLNPKEKYDLSGTSTGKLKEAVERALESWKEEASNNGIELNHLLDFGHWLVPPKIQVKFGPKTVTKRFVELDGFFDVLNVVPRYAPK